MNIKIIDEQQHNKLYDDWIWIERQIVKQLSINKTSCPKEEKVMYTEKPVYLKVFNETYGLIGGFTLPKALEIVYDRFKEGEMVKVKLMEIDDRGRLNFSMKALMERPPRDSKPENSHS